MMISYVECLGGEGAVQNVSSRCWNAYPDEEQDRLLPLEVRPHPHGVRPHPQDVRLLPNQVRLIQSDIRLRPHQDARLRPHDLRLLPPKNSTLQPRTEGSLRRRLLSSKLLQRQTAALNAEGGLRPGSPWLRPPIHPSLAPEAHGKAFQAPEGHGKPPPPWPSRPLTSEPAGVPPQFLYLPNRRRRSRFPWRRWRRRSLGQEAVQTTPLLLRGEGHISVNYSTQNPEQNLHWIPGKRTRNGTKGFTPQIFKTDAQSIGGNTQQRWRTKSRKMKSRFQDFVSQSCFSNCLNISFRRRKSSSSDEEEQFIQTKAQPLTPLVLSPAPLKSCWGLPLVEGEDETRQRLPTPEEKMMQEALTVSADIVPINVSGESFDRQASSCRTIFSPDLTRRSRLLNRRQTVCGPPEENALKLEDDYGRFCTTGRLGVEPDCRKESRRIRAPRGDGISSLMASLTSSCEENNSNYMTFSEAESHQGDLHSSAGEENRSLKSHSEVSSWSLSSSSIDDSGSLSYHSLNPDHNISHPNPESVSLCSSDGEHWSYTNLSPTSSVHSRITQDSRPEYDPLLALGRSSPGSDRSIPSSLSLIRQRRRSSFSSFSSGSSRQSFCLRKSRRPPPPPLRSDSLRPYQGRGKPTWASSASNSISLDPWVPRRSTCEFTCGTVSTFEPDTLASEAPPIPDSHSLVLGPVTSEISLSNQTSTPPAETPFTTTLSSKDSRCGDNSSLSSASSVDVSTRMDLPPPPPLPPPTLPHPYLPPPPPAPPLPLPKSPITTSLPPTFRPPLLSPSPPLPQHNLPPPPPLPPFFLAPRPLPPPPPPPPSHLHIPVNNLTKPSPSYLPPSSLAPTQDLPQSSIPPSLIQPSLPPSLPNSSIPSPSAHTSLPHDLPISSLPSMSQAPPTPPSSRPPPPSYFDAVRHKSRLALLHPGVPPSLQVTAQALQRVKLRSVKSLPAERLEAPPPDGAAQVSSTHMDSHHQDPKFEGPVHRGDPDGALAKADLQCSSSRALDPVSAETLHTSEPKPRSRRKQAGVLRRSEEKTDGIQSRSRPKPTASPERPIQRRTKGSPPSGHSASPSSPNSTAFLQRQEPTIVPGKHDLVPSAPKGSSGTYIDPSERIEGLYETSRIHESTYRRMIGSSLAEDEDEDECDEGGSTRTIMSFKKNKDQPRRRRRRKRGGRQLLMMSSTMFSSSSLSSSSSSSSSGDERDETIRKPAREMMMKLCHQDSSDSDSLLGGLCVPNLLIQEASEEEEEPTVGKDLLLRADQMFVTDAGRSSENRFIHSAVWEGRA